MKNEDISIQQNKETKETHTKETETKKTSNLYYTDPQVKKP